MPVGTYVLYPYTLLAAHLYLLKQQLVYTVKSYRKHSSYAMTCLIQYTIYLVSSTTKLLIISSQCIAIQNSI